MNRRDFLKIAGCGLLGVQGTSRLVSLLVSGQGACPGSNRGLDCTCDFRGIHELRVRRGFVSLDTVNASGHPGLQGGTPGLSGYRYLLIEPGGLGGFRAVPVASGLRRPDGRGVVEIGRHGTIELPGQLWKKILIEGRKSVVVVGMLDHLELYSPGAWKEIQRMDEELFPTDSAGLDALV